VSDFVPLPERGQSTAPKVHLLLQDTFYSQLLSCLLPCRRRSRRFFLRWLFSADCSESNKSPLLPISRRRPNPVLFFLDAVCLIVPPLRRAASFVGNLHLRQPFLFESSFFLVSLPNRNASSHTGEVDEFGTNWPPLVDYFIHDYIFPHWQRPSTLPAPAFIYP